MKRILILGGGFGGISAAHTLRQKLASDDEVILIDAGTHFMVGFRKVWALTGESPLEVGQRPLAALNEQGIRVIQGTVTAIDPNTRSVDVDGQHYQADALIVALGAQRTPEKIPG